MLIKTVDKWEAAHAFINTWLKDKRAYCNNCGMPYFKEEKKEWEPCCENPDIGTNWDFTKRIIDDNKKIRQTRKNDYASNKKRNWRMGVRLPPALYMALKDYFEKGYNTKVFKDNADLHKFMKKFKVFCIPQRI